MRPINPPLYTKQNQLIDGRTHLKKKIKIPDIQHRFNVEYKGPEEWGVGRGMRNCACIVFVQGKVWLTIFFFTTSWGLTTIFIITVCGAALLPFRAAQLFPGLNFPQFWKHFLGVLRAHRNMQFVTHWFMYKITTVEKRFFWWIIWTRSSRYEYILCGQLLVFAGLCSITLYSTNSLDTIKTSNAIIHRVCSALSPLEKCIHMHKYALFNMGDKVAKIIPGTTWPFLRKAQPVKTCREVNGRNGATPPPPMPLIHLSTCLQVSRDYKCLCQWHHPTDSLAHLRTEEQVLCYAFSAPKETFHEIWQVYLQGLERKAEVKQD